MVKHCALTRTELLNSVKHGSGFQDQLNIITFSFGGISGRKPGRCVEVADVSASGL